MLYTKFENCSKSCENLVKKREFFNFWVTLRRRGGQIEVHGPKPPGGPWPVDLGLNVEGLRVQISLLGRRVGAKE